MTDLERSTPWCLALADAAADISGGMPSGMIHGTGTYEKWVLGAIERAFERHGVSASSETKAKVPEISAGGSNPVKLYGTTGAFGTCASVMIYADFDIPEGTIEIRDDVNGRVLGRIINVGR